MWELVGKGCTFTAMNAQNKPLYFEWVAFEQLANEVFYPRFLKDKIFDLPESLTILADHH